ncbi:hypothetical protein ESOMN_v1c01090 [Williamsoniiplasma somnilux]|uniref:Uncharacterized protein n=1 Tax=Williamsoniiplasma somnilux TaxID=215578 RepID=A0A2K8NXM6_9MOLU|nr:hypothetical protein [Williamsoniiplasma somnilux]ATZ18494.1 hypothetical protein ESOMN_v1c01090 [Williamsoniiplasma somnilux]
METSTIEKDLAKSGWSILKKDPFIKDNILPQLYLYLNEKEKVESLAWTRKTNEKGELTATYVLLVLTEKRILALSKNSIVDDSEIRQKWFDIDEIKFLEMENSNIRVGSIRINFIANGVGYALESIDEKSSKHFVDWTEKAIKNFKLNHAHTMTYPKSDNLKNLQKIELTHKTKSKKQNREHVFANYIFDHPSLIKSNPAMQILLFACSFVWLIVESVVSATFDKDGFVASVTIRGTGIFSLVWTILGLIVSIYYIINIWKKDKLEINVILALIVSIGFIFLFVLSILQITVSLSSINMTYIGIFTSLIMSSTTGIIFAKDFIERNNK